MTEDLALSITGYAEDPATGTASVRSYDRAGRMGRAASGVALWWAVAAVCLFIPVAHFLLVPGFAAFGLLVGLRRLRTERVILEFRGTCPDCGTEQAFDVDDRWAPPFDLTCRECGRGLKAKVHHGSN